MTSVPQRPIALYPNLPEPTAAQTLTLRKALARLADLPDAEWEFFRRQLRALPLRKGESLTAVGEIELLSAFIVRGVFRAYYFLESGEEIVRGFDREGDFLLAFSSAIQGQPSNVTIEALEDAELVVLPYRRWQALYPRHACWQEMGRKQAEASYVLREQHSRDLLTKTAAERLASFQERFPEFWRRVAQKHIASYLRIDQATLSRLLGRSLGSKKKR